MSRNFFLACIQLHSSNDMASNLERCRFWIAESVRSGAEFVLLPEDFAFLAVSEHEKLSLSSSQRVSIESCLREESIRHGIYLLAGGYPVREEEDEKIYNVSSLFSPKGEILSSYRKLHLFDADPPGAVPLRESQIVKPGEAIQVIETELGTIGMSICYDLRFPELYRAMAYRGVDLITVPAAFTLTTGKDHWEVLLRARAIENQCYVAAPAQWGRHSDRRHSFGRSMICDPWGTVVACVSEGEGFALAEFRPDYLSKVRQSLPCREHIRYDLFSLSETMSNPPK